MSLALPNLDDRRWSDLVEEGRALIPVYGSDWTDHNVHDPGITLMELLAWISEMDIYQLNQIPDRHKRKFLELIGVVPQPPLAARTVMSIALNNGANPPQPVPFPAGFEFASADSSGVETKVRTLHDLTAVAGGVASVQFQDASGFHDLTAALARGDALQLFGPSPALGAEFYIGLKSALPLTVPVRFFFNFADGQSGWDQRRRLLHETREQYEECHPPIENPCQKAGTPTASQAPPTTKVPAHYGVRTSWEFLGTTSTGMNWVALDPAKNQVEDQTRAFTLDGYVVFMIPSSMAQNKIGAVSTPYFYLRCRIAAGMYDAPPAAAAIAFNAVLAEQAIPVGKSFVISPSATITCAASGPPKPGDTTTVRLQFDDQNNVTSVAFGDGVGGDPEFYVLDYLAPTINGPGRLSLETVLLGFGTGTPAQQFILPELLAQQSSFALFTYQNGSWQEWRRREDFDSATWSDYPYLLDPTSGVVRFSTGEKTNIPSLDAEIFARYRATRADLGNVPAGTITRIADSQHNRALFYPSGSPPGWSDKNSIKNTQPATGGTAAESVAHASARSDNLVETTGRAVTLADYERLAMAIPGTRIARVTARANLHPDFPCFDASGMITVIVVPYLPLGRPYPSPGLRQAVARYLRRRRVIGTRVEVVGPTYVDVAVQATVQAAARVSRAALQKRIVDAINRFLDPLIGGPDGTGWPFGRDVYQPEIMQVIDRVPGVDHIVALSLVGASCEPQCGNMCLGRTWLVAAGCHQIQVV